MGDDLKAIVQGAVVLAIDAALTGIIGESQNLRGILRVLAALVNFQLDTKIAGAASVEDRLRFIVVIMDDTLAAGCTLKAVVAQCGGIVIIRFVVDLRIGQQGSAAFAAGVVALVTI